MSGNLMGNGDSETASSTLFVGDFFLNTASFLLVWHFQSLKFLEIRSN